MADAKKDTKAYTPRLKADYEERIVKAMNGRIEVEAHPFRGFDTEATTPAGATRGADARSSG